MRRAEVNYNVRLIVQSSFLLVYYNVYGSPLPVEFQLFAVFGSKIF